ncbi:MAG: bifunctional precorrin-2 dehydrogenase/sirohydrochlorin ferrochelatase [Desulfovibrio sp.]|jgi:precorrin-2 dehydrogenase/sirohydrochlorin ferrochelatase|nr:bifunctional precorrin-2 dehydrogenase/sirohydrochlorin ferrochelatase [Desulfovibrio sp.]
MRYFPIFIDLSGKTILVLGAGKVGERKILSLLKASPKKIVLIDPGLSSAGTLEKFTALGLECLSRSFRPEDLQGKDLVFAASSDHGLNAEIARLCAGRGILCNCASTPDEGDFFVPAHFSRNELCLAVGTEGASPALAKRLREDLEARLGSRYALTLALLKRLRRPLLELGLGAEADAGLFRALAASPLEECLEKGEKDKAANLLRGLLPDALKSRAGEFLHGL